MQVRETNFLAVRHPKSPVNAGRSLWDWVFNLLVRRESSRLCLGPALPRIDRLIVPVIRRARG